MKWNFISKIFDGAIGIERTYNDCDKALKELGKYNERIEEMQENSEDINSIPESEKAALDEVVDYAIERAKKLLSKESDRNWPGVFREMHKNLANMYFERGDYDKVPEECEQLKNYGEVGRQDAQEIMQKLQDKQAEKSGNAEEQVSSV
ncbi:MAG: hypothetical protein OXP71_07530 [Candidatus Poribacteria bacterium]|nr:hypothetical protein [Candidatus Poribacteria bacterium]